MRKRSGLMAVPAGRKVPSGLVFCSLVAFQPRTVTGVVLLGWLGEQPADTPSRDTLWQEHSTKSWEASFLCKVTVAGKMFSIVSQRGESKVPERPFTPEMACHSGLPSVFLGKLWNSAPTASGN